MLRGETGGMDVLVVNGPNLNLLGTRNPSVYGHTTLADLESSLRDRGRELGLDVTTYQHNHEGALVDRIQEARTQGCRYIIVNAGAYTHTSVAIADAFEAVQIPYVEVHISNVYAREEFRHRSLLSANASAVIVGAGVYGYRLALDLVAERLGGAGSADA
jgi:3-dehydroquinate dehydratase II